MRRKEPSGLTSQSRSDGARRLRIAQGARYGDMEDVDAALGGDASACPAEIVNAVDAMGRTGTADGVGRSPRNGEIRAHRADCGIL